MRIGIDCDGVLCDFNKSYIQLIKDLSGEDKFGPNYVPQIWNYPESVGYEKEIVQAAWEKIESDPTFWFLLEPLKDMNTLVRWIESDDHDLEHDVYFITSRPGKSSKLQTEAWFAQWDIPATVLVSSEKGMCCEALRLDRYVDDKVENIVDVGKRDIKTIPFLLDQPWNKSGGKRIYSLEEFFTHVA